MSDAALVIVALLALSLAGGFTWAMYALMTERAAHSATTLDRDRARFELTHTAEKLADVEQRLASIATRRPDENPNADLAAGDRDARLVRAAIKAKADAARRSGAVRSDAGQAVPARPAAADADVDRVPSAGPLDPNESLL